MYLYVLEYVRTCRAVVGERRALRLVMGEEAGISLGLDVCLCLGSLVEKEWDEGGVCEFSRRLISDLIVSAPWWEKGLELCGACLPGKHMWSSR